MNYAIFGAFELEGERFTCFLGSRHFFFQAEALIVDFASDAEVDYETYTVVEL